MSSSSEMDIPKLAADIVGAPDGLPNEEATAFVLEELNKPFTEEEIAHANTVFQRKNDLNKKYSKGKRAAAKTEGAAVVAKPKPAEGWSKLRPDQRARLRRRRMVMAYSEARKRREAAKAAQEDGEEEDEEEEEKSSGAEESKETEQKEDDSESAIPGPPPLMRSKSTFRPSKSTVRPSFVE